MLEMKETSSRTQGINEGVAPLRHPYLYSPQFYIIFVVVCLLLYNDLTFSMKRSQLCAPICQKIKIIRKTNYH